MKARLFDSIRMQLVVSMLLSMICVLITDLLLLCGIWLVKKTTGNMDFANQQRPWEENYEMSLADKVDKGTENAGDTEAETTPEESKYAPNEYVPEEDRMYTVTFRMRHGGIITSNVFLDMFIVFTFSVLAFVVYYMIFTNKLIQYFNEINTGIHCIQNGDLHTEIRVRGTNELATIAASINEMQYILRKNIESERNSEMMKNELVTSVAHDLRTPLTSTIGYLELLHRTPGLNADTKKKYIEVAYQKSKTLEDLINELFDYTRFQKGKVNLNVTKLNITIFLQQLLEEFYPQMEEARLKSVIDIPDAKIEIFGDGEKLARAFSNLISNAIKYGADGKQLKIALIELEEQVYVSITNYGRVIPQENLPYIFDKFYRVEQSRSHNTGGTGLGLAIAKNIVLMHEGEISAKSDEHGTTFTVCLPKVQEDT